MTKNILFLAGLFISIALNAQITVSLADTPTAGDSVKVSVNTSVGSSDPTLTGANYTWDYSSLTPTSQQYEKFDTPQSFISPFNFLFNSNNTSYGQNNYEFTTISLPGASITSAYDFYKETGSQLKQVGSGYTINSTPIPFIYSSADVIYNFPIDYLNNDSCDFKFGLPIPNTGYYGETGHRVNIVDGWGEITTPFGTFQVLRLTSTIKAIDSIYSTSLSLGTNVSRPLRYEFKWLAAGMTIPVLKIDANVVAGNLTVTNVRYVDSTRTGVPQVGIAENTLNNLNVTVYPNPCVNEINLKYNLVTATPIKISITDIIGKTVVQVSNENQISGAHQKSISIPDLKLTSGIYFLNLQTTDFK
jgi:hypothetical protein